MKRAGIFLRVSVLTISATWTAVGQDNAAGTNVVGPDAIVRAAREYSPAVRMAAGGVGIAEGRLKQARGARLPAIDVKAAAADYQGLEPFVLNGVTIVDKIEERFSASAGVTVPVYTGGRLSANERSSEYGRQAAAETRAGVESDVTLAALTAFWTWSKAYHGQTVRQSAVARMEAHAADMRNRRAAGMATEYEVLATEVRLEQMRLQLETARRGVRQSLARIAYLTGSEQPSNAIPRAADGAPGAALPSEADAVRSASSRPELAARRKELAAAETAAGASGSERLPQVALMARYEQARPNMMNIPPKDQWQQDSFVGAVLTWNLFDWGVVDGKEAEARARVLQARAGLEQMQAQVTLEVRDARIALQDARGRTEVAARAVESARKSLQAVTDMWQGGLARHAEVLDAHSQLDEAEYQLLSARADATLATAALEHAMGKRMAD